MKRIAATLLASVLVFGLCQLILVKSGFYRRMSEETVRRLHPEETIIQRAEPSAYMLDERVGIKLKPNTKIRFKSPAFDVSVETNNEGFTGRNFPLKSQSDYRIAVLGDSMVEAYGVPDELRFTQLTEKLIYERSPKRYSVEMMGFGASGWGPVHQYGALKHFVLKYKPNEAWFMFMPTNDFGDDTPIFNGPPIGPTFVYKDRDEKELVDIQFGFPVVPAKLHALREQRYGRELLDSVMKRWTHGLLPFFYSLEHDPTWDLIERQTYQTFGLIKKLLDQHAIKMRVVYRSTGYDEEISNFSAFKEETHKFLGRPLQMEQHLGEARMQQRLQKMGIDFISLRKLPELVVETQAQEFEAVKHAKTASFFADYVLKNILK